MEALLTLIIVVGALALVAVVPNAALGAIGTAVIAQLAVNALRSCRRRHDDE